VPPNLIVVVCDQESFSKYPHMYLSTGENIFLAQIRKLGFSIYRPLEPSPRQVTVSREREVGDVIRICGVGTDAGRGRGVERFAPFPFIRTLCHRF
jgi:hypothetical protein